MDNEATRDAVTDALFACRQAALNVEIAVEAHTDATATKLGLEIGQSVMINDPLGQFSSTIAGFRMDSDRLDTDNLWVRTTEDSPVRGENIFLVTWVSRHMPQSQGAVDRSGNGADQR